jgi:peptidylprolyl isomerase
MVTKSEGSGDSPKPEQMVKFHFTAYGPNGQVMQSTKQGGQPQAAPVDKLPPFFQEPLAGMKPGGVAELFIPGNMVGAPDEFVRAELELLEVNDPTPAPPVPEDVATVPEDAQKTESGLAYKVLESGDGGAKPGATSKVTVHYSGWETNGQMFDSSVTRGEPAQFGLNQVIRGWTEGVQLMSKGDKFRFWIPEGLAYGPKQEGSGRPGGLLVFDVELIEIQ